MKIKLFYINTSLIFFFQLLLATQAFAIVLTSPGDFANTQLQKDTGDAVLTTCKGLDKIAIKPKETAALSKTCTVMVLTANELAGEADFGLSLGQSQDELASSLQQIATEEFANTQSTSTEISNNQINSSISRLVELRSGVKGFSFAGLFPQQQKLIADNPAYSGGAAGTDWQKMGGFVSASYGFGDRDSTDRTNGFDYDSIAITGGLDYRINSNVIVGAMLNYHDINSDFDKTATVAGGDIEADGWGGSIYGTYYTNQAYIDLTMGYGMGNYDMKRNIIIPSNNPTINEINLTAKGNTDSDDFVTSIGAGYDIVNNALTYGPYGRLSYSSVDIDGYSEKGAEASGLNLKVQGQKWKSLTSTLGAKFSYSLSHSFGVVVPQASIGWIHEFESDAQDINATYVADPNQHILKATTNKPDRDYFEMNLGVSTVHRGGAQFYVSYDTILGLNDINQHLISVGGRWEF